MGLRALAVLAAFLLILGGCSDDSGPADSGPGDDTGIVRDTGVGADSGMSGDAGDAGDSGTGGPDDGRLRLVTAATRTATTIELVFSRAVDGMNLGFSLNGTRSAGFESLTGFGTATLTGTVAADVVYGEVVTVSYDDTLGDIAELPWYRRELVTNNETFAGAEVYVAADATGTGDGTRDRPFTVAQVNVSSNVAVGMRVNIEKGVYTQRLVVNRSGEAGRPIIYQGYDTEPGDTDYSVFHPTYPTPLDGTRMPLFDGGNRDTNVNGGVSINNKRFVTFMNLQVKDYRTGFKSSFSTPADNLAFINCATEDIGDTTSSSQGSGFHINYSSTRISPFNISLVHCYARNSAMANFGISGADTFIYGTRSYSDQDVYPGSGELFMSTDYHFGVKNADDGVIRGCHAENVGDLEHTAHGISIRSDVGDTSHRVLIDDCDVVNINGSIELRHDEVKYALVRNVRITGGSSRYAGGLQFRDGASFNVIDGCRVGGITAGSNGAIAFYDSVEEGRGQTIEGNVIMNTVFEDVNLLFRMSSGSDPVFALVDNSLYNNTFYDVDVAYRRYDNLTNTNFVATNNIYSGVAAQDHGSSDASSGIIETYNDYVDGYGMPAGEGNVAVDPMFVDAAGGDFHLGEGSPVRDAGADLAAVVHDFDGVVRESGSYSMGAYE